MVKKHISLGAGTVLAGIALLSSLALAGCGGKEEPDATAAPAGKAATAPAGTSTEGQMSSKSEALPPPPGFKPTPK